MTTYYCPECKTTTQVGPTRDYREVVCDSCQTDPNHLSALGRRMVDAEREGRK